MMTAAEITEIAIISFSCSFALGYVVGIAKHLVEQYKSEKNFTLPLV
jgi:hypothetical protein